MKVDLSCPVELRGYELTSDDAGRTRASVRLYNLAGRRISAFEAVVRWENSRTGASAAVPFTAEHLRAGGRSYFTLSLSTDLVCAADYVELNFTRVRFEDGDREWRAGGGMIVEISETEPLSGPEQNALLALAGEDAIRFPEENEKTWTCVCGRVNLQSGRPCVRCGRGHDDVFPALTRESVLASDIRVEAVLDLDDMPLDERRDMRRREERMHRELRRKRAALIRRTAVAAVAVLALVLFGCIARGGASAESLLPPAICGDIFR